MKRPPTRIRVTNGSTHYVALSVAEVEREVERARRAGFPFARLDGRSVSLATIRAIDPPIEHPGGQPKAHRSNGRATEGLVVKRTGSQILSDPDELAA